MIVVTARTANRRLGMLLKGSCKELLSILFLETDHVSVSGEGADVVFVTQQAFEKIACENAVFVVRGGACLPAQQECTNAVAIVDSSDTAVMAQVAACHLKALTCGLSGSDTFTLSSLTSDSAVISLQRRLTAFDGTVIDPFELPVTFSTRIEPFLLLACAAIYCLLGKRNPLTGAASWHIHRTEHPHL